MTLYVFYELVPLQKLGFEKSVNVFFTIKGEYWRYVSSEFEKSLIIQPCYRHIFKIAFFSFYQVDPRNLFWRKIVETTLLLRKSRCSRYRKLQLSYIFEKFKYLSLQRSQRGLVFLNGTESQDCSILQKTQHLWGPS